MSFDVKHYVVIVECAIEFDGKFLIIRRPEGKHAGGMLGCAGGKVDEQDEANDFDVLRSATRREIFEELGLELTGDLHYVTSEYFADNKGTQVIGNLFHYRFDFMPNVVPAIDEVPWYGWMTREEINAAPNSPPWLKKQIALISD